MALLLTGSPQAADFEHVCGPEPPLPIARAQDEMRGAMTELRRYLRRQPLNPTTFWQWTKPYGPLDIEVRGVHSAREASDIKNFVFGLAGTFADIDPQVLSRAGMGFLARYGQRQQKEPWASRVEEHRVLVEQFRALVDVRVLALWGDGEYRIGDEFGSNASSWMGRCSEVLGLCPWTDGSAMRVLTPVPEDQRVAAQAILARMHALEIPALVRQPSGLVRVVQDGVADDEVGTLFAEPGAADPEVNDELTDGKTIIWLDPLAPGIFYYLAN